ncbi:ABC transporter permease, partial [Providencia rettgeri]|nr:ABC transporter permease [Providencia rettgeri]
MSTHSPSFWQARLRPVLAHPKVLIGGVRGLSFSLVALFAPLLAPNDPNAQDLLPTLLPPAWQEGG